MKRRTRWIVGAGLAVALVGGGTAMAVATGGDDHETPITGEALGKASAAALAHTGGGRVTGTEVGDEEGYYEVEVTLPGGGQVDVHLDRAFNLLNTTGDQDSKSDQDGSNDR
jgi:hypothetical protein